MTDTSDALDSKPKAKGVVSGSEIMEILRATHG